jgi:hypothetical protein
MDIEREQVIDDAASWGKLSPLMQLVETVAADSVLAMARAARQARSEVPRRLARGTGANVALERPPEPLDEPSEPIEVSDPPRTSTLTGPRRRARRTRPRSQTIAMKRVSRAERAAYAELFPIADVQDLRRPKTRADCREQAGPCPWVACKHHLYLDINPMTGSIKLNFPDLEPWELEHTCALDVAEAGALTLEQVGEITNLTRERVRQVEVIGLSKLAGSAKRHGLR